MASADFTIVPSSDAALVTELTLAAWRGTVDVRSSGQRFSVSDAEALFAEGAIALIARNGSGVPIGSVIVVPGKAEGSAELTKLAVPSRADRGHGLGSRLIDAAKDVAGSWDVHELVLAVSLYQPQLCRYYARRGFVVDPTRTYGHASPHSPKPIVMVRALTGGSSSSVALVTLEPRPDPIGDAARALTDGHLVILPTETVYGLGALASDPVAVRRVFATKGRPVDHPLIVHVAHREAMAHWADDVPESAWKLAERLWPGPLTLVLNKAAWVPYEVTGGLETVAIRVPRHADTLAVLGLLPLNAGVAAPSANRFGRVSPTTAADAYGDLATYLAPGDLLVDGGPCSVGVESTILDLTTTVPTILRPGGCSVAEIEDVLGLSVERVATGPARAPGMLAAHYAPMAGVLVVAAEVAAARVSELSASGQRVGYLGPDRLLPSEVDAVRLISADPYTGESLAPILYARLREADRLGLDVLVVVTPSDEGLGYAVNDRLRRAQAGSGR
jgi:L-threonylcarbamoyladenylate synthase